MSIICPHCKEGVKYCWLIGTDVQYVGYDSAFSTCDCELNDDEMGELLIAAQQASMEYEP